MFDIIGKYPQYLTQLLTEINLSRCEIRIKIITNHRISCHGKSNCAKISFLALAVGA